MDKLVQRLRWLQLPGDESEATVMMARAADRIEADAARIERLKAERDALLADTDPDALAAAVMAEREKRKASRRSEWESSPDNPANW